MRQYGKRKYHGKIHGHWCPTCSPSIDTRSGKVFARRNNKKETEDNLKSWRK